MHKCLFKGSICRIMDKDSSWLCLFVLISTCQCFHVIIALINCIQAAHNLPASYCLPVAQFLFLVCSFHADALFFSFFIFNLLCSFHIFFPVHLLLLSRSLFFSRPP